MSVKAHHLLLVVSAGLFKILDNTAHLILTFHCRQQNKLFSILNTSLIFIFHSCKLFSTSKIAHIAKMTSLIEEFL